MSEKNLYCPKCKKYPDKIVEEETVLTRRKWDCECYQAYDTEYIENSLKSYCANCDTKLIDTEYDQSLIK